jgi:DNA-directed RNA polymerase specialized sigma24 family protein
MLARLVWIRPSQPPGTSPYRPLGDLINQGHAPPTHSHAGPDLFDSRQKAVEWRGRRVTVGPSEAFTLFFKNNSDKNNSDPVFRTLLAGTLNRAAAEDATAEAFARAFAHWDTVAVHPNPKAWVLRVAWNCYGSSWRKWESRWTADLPELTPPTPEPWNDPDLIAAIRALPQSQREVIVLVALGELTPIQAARVLGKPAGTVRRLLFQARVALHQALDEATAPEEEDD